MIWAAFILGITGSLHCIGMCGPIAIPLSQLNAEDRTSNLFYSLKYNAGRIISYTILGLVFGFASQIMKLSFPQNALSIAAGIFLILLFLMSMDLEKLMFRSSIFSRLYAKVQKILSKIISFGAARFPVIIGMANGVLPCGLVYLALAGALTSGSAIQGGLFMMIFGLGTVPAMLGLMIGSSFIGNKYRGRFRKIYPYMHLLFGVLLIVRGLGPCSMH